MNTTGKIGWLLALVLAIGLGAMSYFFLLKGQTLPYADGRISVLLTADQRNASLAEMRDILESVQEIMEMTIAGDFEGASARHLAGHGRVQPGRPGVDCQIAAWLQIDQPGAARRL